MEEWKEYKIEDIGKITTGKTPKTAIKEYFDGNILFVTPADINTPYKYVSKTARYLSEKGLNSISSNSIEKGSICVSCIGNIGYVGIVNMKCASNQQINSITVNKEHDRDFVYYAIKNLWPFFKNYEGQSTTLSILNKGQFSKIVIKAPQKDIQQRIASILSSLDDKIEVNCKIIENLEQQARALFKSWFVDFDPFKDGEFIESELGMIPKGWRVYSMNELVDIIGGYSYKGNELQESTTAMATIKNFERSGGFKINGFKEIIPSPKAKQEQFLEKFDIIIAHTDLTQNADIIGNPALILHFGGYDRLIMSMDLVKVKSKNDYITYGLLYSIFADARFKSHALGYVNGTTVLHLSKKAIPEYKLALPHDFSILAKYGKSFDSLFAKEAEMMEETDRLATLRDTLLPKLMSGELKVNKVEI